MSFFNVKENLSSWEPSVDAVQYINLAERRLKKLCNLEKTILKKENPKPRRLTKIQEEGAKARYNLELLGIYKSKLKTKGKGEKMMLISKMKKVIGYARKTELNYRKYLGVEPEYLPEDKIEGEPE